MIMSNPSPEKVKIIFLHISSSIPNIKLYSQFSPESRVLSVPPVIAKG